MRRSITIFPAYVSWNDNTQKIYGKKWFDLPAQEWSWRKEGTVDERKDKMLKTVLSTTENQQ